MNYDNSGKFSKLGIDNAPGQESLQKSAALEIRGEASREQRWISHMEMSTRMSRFRAVLKYLQRGLPRVVPRPIRLTVEKKAYWNMLHPAYQPLQGSD